MLFVGWAPYCRLWLCCKSFGTFHALRTVYTFVETNVTKAFGHWKIKIILHCTNVPYCTWINRRWFRRCPQTLKSQVVFGKYLKVSITTIEGTQQKVAIYCNFKGARSACSLGGPKAAEKVMACPIKNLSMEKLGSSKLLIYTLSTQPVRVLFIVFFATLASQFRFVHFRQQYSAQRRCDCLKICRVSFVIFGILSTRPCLKF